MKLFLSLFLLILTTNIYAQQLKTIKYDGLVHLSENVALRMINFTIGDDIVVQDVDSAIKKYFEQGYFNDVWTEFEDGELIFYFKEKAIISKVVLSGWKEDADAEEIASVIQIKKGSLFDQTKIDAAKKRIIEAISQDGKIDSVIEIQKDYLDNGSIKLVFIVSEGQEILISNLTYNGVTSMDSDDFDSVIGNKEKDYIPWFWGQNDGKMSLQDLSYDNLRIKDFYMQNGYLDAVVNEPFVRVNFNHYTADMSYQIYEGEAYTISKVSILQSKKVMTETDLRKFITLEKGEVFDIKKFRSDAQNIKTAVSDLSYAFAQVVPDLKKNKEDHTVEVVFKINPGEKVKIRNVVISGNTRTLDRIVRRELYLGPNDLYSLTDLKDSRAALGRLGFFDGTTIEEKRIDNKNIDLVVKLKEASTGSIQLGGGYGSYGGLLLSIGVNDRNIWGSGINVGVKAEKSQRSENYSFNVSNNRLNDSDFSGNFSIFHSSNEIIDAYSIFSDGISVGVGHRFSRYVSGYVGYGYSSNIYEPASGADLEEFKLFNFENYSKSAISFSVKWDNTDDFYLAREGFDLSQSFEKSGLSGDANFLKARTNYAKYTGLEEWIGIDAIFRYKARLSLVIDNGFVPVAEKFFMGGIGSVRGYQSYSLSPGVDALDGTRRAGGEKTFSNSLELSFPLIPTAKMRLVTYVDWGLIGDDSLLEVSRGGYGAGLEWFSPVGPIQLMFSNPLNAQEGDRVANFEFTMGQRF